MNNFKFPQWGLIVVITFVLSGCVDLDSDKSKKTSANNNNDEPTTPAAISTLSDAPLGSSGVINLSITVGGTDIETYRYKIGSHPGTDCEQSSGYSDETSIEALITNSIAGLPDGGIIVCSVGKNTTGTWQSYSSATSVTWTKSTTLKTIYRSMGHGSTGALATGAGNGFTISGSVAAFNFSLPSNIGVGDAIQYDSDNDTIIDAIAFISWRMSGSSFIVRNAAGDTPVPVVNNQSWSLFRSYTSLGNALTGTENNGIDAAVRNFDNWAARDLVSSNEQWNIAMYNDAAGSGDTWLNDWTTSSTNFLKIYTPVNLNEVGTKQRHTGVLGTGYHHNGFIWGGSILFYRLEGLSVSKVSDSDNKGVLGVWPVTGTSEAYLIDNIIKSTGTNADIKGIWLYAGSNSHLNKVFIINNIIIDEVTGSNPRGIYVSLGSDGSTGEDQAYIFNNTIISVNGTAFLRNSADVDLRNNIATGNACFGDWGGSGSVLPSSTHNAASCNSVWASVSRDNQTFTFVDDGSDDYRLSLSDSGAQGHGTNLSTNGLYNFSSDIVGAPRGSSWDIGASGAY